MKARVRTAAAAGAAVLTGGVAFAAEPVTESSATVAVLASASNDGEPVTARAAFRIQHGLLFDNQIEAGFGIGAAAERDDPRRDPRGGLAGDCLATQPACPSAGGGPLRSPVSGYITQGPAADEGARLSLESAYLYLRGGWGEASLGRDEGAAKRFSLLPPTILAIGGAIDAPVDGTGLGGAVLRNDVSGQSAKIVVASTRIIGLQAAGSWTPRIEHRGLDQGFRRGPAQTFRAENVAEAGLSYAGRAGDWDLALGATYAHAGSGGGPAEFGAMDGWSAGFTLARNGWRGGLAWLANNNGWAAGGRGYTALGASVVRDIGDWSVMLEAASMSDNLVFVDNRTATAAVRRTVGERWAFAGGANWADRSSPVGVGSARFGRNERGFGAFVEISYGL